VTAALTLKMQVVGSAIIGVARYVIKMRMAHLIRLIVL